MVGNNKDLKKFLFTQDNNNIYHYTQHGGLIVNTTIVDPRTVKKDSDLIDTGVYTWDKPITTGEELIRAVEY